MAEVDTSAPTTPPTPTLPEAPPPAFDPSLYQMLVLERRRRSEAERALREAQEKRLCLICIERAKCVVFLPCAHMMACDACGPACVRVLSGYRCPAPGCNRVISHVVVAQEVEMLTDEQTTRAGFG